MKYVITKTVGPFTYYLKIKEVLQYNEPPILIWYGIIDNATRFEDEDSAKGNALMYLEDTEYKLIPVKI